MDETVSNALLSAAKKMTEFALNPEMPADQTLQLCQAAEALTRAATHARMIEGNLL